MKQLRLSHSAIAAFLRCPRLWYLSYIAELTIAGNRPRPLDFGNAFHAGLEQWWTGCGSPVDRLEAAHAAFQAAGESLSFEDRVLGPELLTGYAVTYGDDEMRSSSTPLGECKLEVPVLDPDGRVDESMVLVAKLDEVGFDLAGDSVLYEHKTTTSDLASASFWSRFDHTLQTPLYFIAMADVGRPLTKAVVDVVRAPQMKRQLATPPERREYYKRAPVGGEVGDPKPGTRLRDETRDEFAVRAREVVLDNPQAYYARKEYTYTPEQLTAARGDLWATGRLMQAVIATDGAAPRNSDGCNRFGGQCGFYSACYGGARLSDTTLFMPRSKT